MCKKKWRQFFHRNLTQRLFVFSFTDKNKTRKSAYFSSQRVIFADEIVDVLWLFKILIINKNKNLLYLLCFAVSSNMAKMAADSRGSTIKFLQKE
ncbi:hypothetical protein HR13_05700 [Porphyromonas gulae]|nr:hypothetical protein HR13_05700 [Porphyromonas gulae]KGN91424.1 hypothetical protein HQ46_01770 [Porphyromonas gulae]KGO03107.1 hypothetical protein HQ42_03145 [Porphyromonas gulae]